MESEIDFSGPNNLLLEDGNISCQFGGVYFMITSRRKALSELSVSFCETIFLQSDRLNTHYTDDIYIRFYAGYSSGSVKIKIRKFDFDPLSLNLNKRICVANMCAGSDVHVWKENRYNMAQDGDILDKTKYVFFDTVPIWHPYFVEEPLYVPHVQVHITAGGRDHSVMMGLVHFVLSLQCAEDSTCHTEYNISAGMLQENVTSETYQHVGSVHIDKLVVYARLISVSVSVLNVNVIQLKVLFEELQHCNYNAPNKYAQQIRNNGCSIIKVKQSLGNAHFLPQLSQDFSIGLDPACPVKECISINVKLAPSVSTLYGQYEWKGTVLEYIPVKLGSYGAVSLAWTYSTQCPIDYQFTHHVCDIWVTVEAQRYLDYYHKYQFVLIGPEYLSVTFLPLHDQLHFYRM